MGVQILKITLRQFPKLRKSVENIEPILFTKISLVPIKLTISMGGGMRQSLQGLKHCGNIFR